MKKPGFEKYEKVNIVRQIIDKMSAHAILNKLEPKIIVLGHAVEEIKSTLTDFDGRVNFVDGIQDKIEDRLTVVEGKVTKIEDHLHLLVDTLNVVLKKLNKDYHEEILTSDEEFDFDDWDDKIDEEVRRMNEQ